MNKLFFNKKSEADRKSETSSTEKPFSKFAALFFVITIAFATVVLGGCDLIDMKAARSIHDYKVTHVALCKLYGLLCGFDRVLGAPLEYGYVQLLANHLQLLYCGRPVNVAGYQQGIHK